MSTPKPLIPFPAHPFFFFLLRLIHWQTHNLVIQLYSSFLTPPFLTRLYCRIGFFNYTLEIYNKIT